MPDVQNDPPVELSRRLGLTLLTIYGLGTIVGGGFYGLIGKVSGEAGLATPCAFLLASLIAALSAASFGELSARFPFSAGEAHYVGEAFQRRWLSTLVGWLVITTGVVSAATLARIFSGFAQEFVTVSEWGLIAGAVLLLGLVAAWGIGESVMVGAVITVIEVGGLIYIVCVGGYHLADLPERASGIVPLHPADWGGVVLGAYLAFYSFVGFEDMVNVAEEVKQPTRTMPRAIFLSVGLTALIYLLVSLVAVLAVPLEELRESSSPLSLLLNPAGVGPELIRAIGMFAGINGALVQIVMASRVGYGLANKGGAPRLLARVHPWTRTPLHATALMTAVVLILALWFPVRALAEMTSTVLLAVYALVNAALWKIKSSPPPADYDGPDYPRSLPVLGAAACIAFVAYRLVELIGAAMRQ